MNIRAALALFDLRKSNEIERDRILREAAVAADKHDVSATGRLIARAGKFAPVAPEVVIGLLRRTFGIESPVVDKRRAA